MLTIVKEISKKRILTIYSEGIRENLLLDTKTLRLDRIGFVSSEEIKLSGFSPSGYEIETNSASEFIKFPEAYIGSYVFASLGSRSGGIGILEHVDKYHQK